MWADRVTVWKRFGCSPFFMVTGVHPILLLDVQEATWLVKLPDRMLTTEELIGYRVRALAKHRVHVADMRKRVSAEKQARLAKYEKDHRNKIDDRIYGPGDLVLVRNLVIESSMSRKTPLRKPSQRSKPSSIVIELSWYAMLFDLMEIMEVVTSLDAVGYFLHTGDF